MLAILIVGNGDDDTVGCLLEPRLVECEKLVGGVHVCAGDHDPVSVICVYARDDGHGSLLAQLGIPHVPRNKGARGFPVEVIGVDLPGSVEETQGQGDNVPLLARAVSSSVLAGV